MFKKLGKALGFAAVAAAAVAGGVAIYKKLKGTDEDFDDFEDFDDDDFDDDFSDLDVENRTYTSISPEEKSDADNESDASKEAASDTSDETK